ncbi:MAG: M55 family metallopeptidase, partial [Candidatus Eremiobacteraeota bacterium]|nr:M55 family metallopeptidase [Candidatus Eremiobacteraeota bacterium]
MKIYISCDMEGTAGVCSWAQCDPSNTDEYPIYRRYMSREVRAAIDGARESGATEFLINDSHWDMRNLLWDELPEDVRVVSGGRKPLSMAQGFGPGFAGALFTGYHGKAGEAGSTLAHTYTSDSIFNVTINGTLCSEATLNAAFAGSFGIPLLLVTGDTTIVRDVQTQMPWVAGVAVKDSIGYYAADSLTPLAACDAIRAGARDAVARAGEAKTFAFAPPVTMEIEFARVECADFVELMPEFQRIGGRTVRFTGPDYPSVYRAFVAAFRLAGAAL